MRVLPIALLGLACAVAPLAQDAAPPDTDERVAVRLVQLVFRARAGGDAVTDLQADEIVVKESGRTMRVAFLEPFVPSPGADPSVVRLYVGAPGAAAGVVQVSAAVPRYVVFLVDRDNDYLLNKETAVEDSLAFVREGLDGAVRIAVFAYDGELHLEQGFTVNREEAAMGLLRAWDRDARPGLDLQARMRGLMDQLEGCARRESGDRIVRQGDDQCLRGAMLDYVDERRPLAEGFFDALERLIRFSGGLRQRVTIVALSHGVAADVTDELIEAMQAVYGNSDQLGRMRLDVGFGEGARRQLDALMESALEQRVTVHFVDRMPAPSGDFSARQGAAFQPGARPMQVAYAAPQVDLDELATHTGGLFVHDTDVGKGLERIAQADSGSYLLGYYVDEYLPSDRLAKVKIRSTRKGVRIAHRRGYYARPQSSMDLAVDLTPGAPLEPEPLPETEAKAGTDTRPWFQPFTITIDPARAGYEPRGDSATTTLTLLFRVEDDRGRVLAESYHLFGHAFPLDVWNAGQAEPLQISGWTELPPGKYRLAVYLTHTDAGTIGEAEQYLDLLRPASP